MKASFIDCIFLILPEMVKKNVLDWPWPVEFRSLVLLYMLFSWSENLYFSHASSLWSVWLNPLSPSILSLCVDLRKSFSIFLYLEPSRQPGHTSTVLLLVQQEKLTTLRVYYSSSLPWERHAERPPVCSQGVEGLGAKITNPVSR